MIPVLSVETILIWGIYLCAVCVVLSLYEMGILLGTKIVGGQFLACDCGFGPLVFERSIKGIQYKIRLLPITIGNTIAIRESSTNRLIVRRPLIVQLRRRYGVDLGALSGIARIAPSNRYGGSLLLVVCVATTTLLVVSSIGAFADSLLVLLSRFMGPLTCCTAGRILAAGSMLCGASVVVAAYNLLPVRRMNDGGLLLQNIEAITYGPTAAMKITSVQNQRLSLSAASIGQGTPMPLT